MAIELYDEYSILRNFIDMKGLDAEFQEYRNNFIEENCFTVRCRHNYRCGEYGVFFDIDPNSFIEKVRELNGFNGLHENNIEYQLGVCEGSGKFQVCNETGYWNYYIPESDFDKLWDPNKKATKWKWGL